jgi:hypothetical protein
MEANAISAAAGDDLQMLSPNLAASPVEGKRPMAEIDSGTGVVELDDVGANMQELGDDMTGRQIAGALSNDVD